MNRILLKLSLVMLFLTLDVSAREFADLGERPVPFRELRDAFPPVSVVIEGQLVCLELDIVLADTSIARSRGLMFVKAMPDNAGMLFFYPQPREMSMWMKNTLIALDIIFAKSDGTIARILADVPPLTLDSRASGEAVQYVL